MNNATGRKRVILITGDKNNWYEQAIFIVRKNIPKKDMPIDFICEAEKIIDEYVTEDKEKYSNNKPKVEVALDMDSTLNYTNKNKNKNKYKKFDFLLNIAMLLGCVAIAGILFYSALR